MDLSTGLPRQKGLAAMQHVVGSRTTAKTVSRHTETVNALDEVETTTTDHTEQLWLFDPNDTVAEEITGERIGGQLGGLAVADGTVDLQPRDTLDHGGLTYEVDTVVGEPNEDDPSMWRIELTEQQ